MPVSQLYFDRFELQVLQRRLLRDGEPVVLGARAFDLLVALAERPGELVTKSALLDLVWPGQVVEENNIAAQIVALRKVLGGELIATVPGRGYRFTAEVRAAQAAAPVVAPPVAAVAAQRLYGRDADQAGLEGMLQVGGCVTLVGPGGVGKTVLARSVAARWAAGPVAWVDLAAVAEGTLLVGALCRATGIPTPAAPAEALAAVVSVLGDGRRLCVLDNAEHLVEAVAALAAQLLAALPTLPLLVTSQMPLRIAGERVQPLEPLPLAQEADAFEAPAVALMLDRVRAADPRFPLDATALPLLRRLGARLDGLPLALEMAAAMVPTLGLPGVLAALDQRFAALKRGQRGAPARHKTLRGAMEWSHGLLPAPAQRLFRRLGVWSGGFSLDLAVAVGADDQEDRWDVVDNLSELVDRSLVASLHVDPPRYRLLETMRSYALEQLDGESEAVHARAVFALTETMTRSGHLDPVAAAELGNVPELLAWSRVHDPAAAVALALDAGQVATWTPWLGEAAHWIESCEPLLDRIPLERQAAWWRELARFQSFVRGPRTIEAARKACELERGLGNPDGLFWSLIPLLRSRLLAAEEFEVLAAEARALLDDHPEWPARNRVVYSGSLALEYRRRGDFEAALVHQQAEAEEAERAGLQQVADNAKSNLVATLVGLGRFEAALDLVGRLLLRSGDAPSPIGAHNRLRQLDALIGLGRLDEALQQATETLRWCRRFEVLDIFQVLALLAARLGRPALAAMYVGYYRHCLQQRGADLPEDRHAPWREARKVAEHELGASALQDGMARGAGLTAEQADRMLFEAH